ncbi:MAG: ZIP family metal transporter [Ignavibacteriaceae bacterium]|nr:ZIP family metal transporter [Ignavibacteriaceae bacterium]
MLTEILIKSSAAVASAVFGAVFLFSIKLSHNKLCALISFSAGALLGAAAFTLLPESAQSINLLELVLGAATGYLLFYFISKYFSHVCPACSASHFDETTTKKFSEIVLTLLVALSIHSLLDGMALASGGAEHIQGENDSVFIAIMAHKFPEGLALAALMIGSNYTRKKILLSVAGVEAVTIVGAVLGQFIFQSNIPPAIMGAVMAHIAGGFVYLAVHAVFGEMIKSHKYLVITSFTAGILLILLVSFLFS